MSNTAIFRKKNLDHEMGECYSEYGGRWETAGC